jgi:predicted DNA-binding protein YlxM (UPF0122 family)
MLSPRCNAILRRLGLDTLKSVLMVYPNHLLSEKNFGECSLRELRQSVCDYLDYRNKASDSFKNTGESFLDFILILCRSSELSRKEVQVLTERLGDAKTLEDIAKELRCSRERIRQILKKALKQLEQHFVGKSILHSFQNKVGHILKSFRGIINLEELGEQLEKDFGWNKPVYAESLREFFRLLTLDKEINLQDDNIVCNYPCRKCLIIVERLSKLMDASPSGKLSLLDIADSNALCEVDPLIGCPTNDGLKYSQSFLIELSKRANLIYHKGYIYSNHTWALQRGGLVKKVEAIMDKIKIAASPQKVWEQLCPNIDNFTSSERIHNALIIAPNIVVWGRAELNIFISLRTYCLH